MDHTIDTARLARIEADLADDVLTDADLVTALNEAGLPELARVISRATQPRR